MAPPGEPEILDITIGSVADPYLSNADPGLNIWNNVDQDPMPEKLRI